jgi:integrase
MLYARPSLYTYQPASFGEALGLEIRHLSCDCRTIAVEQSCWEGELQIPKTKNAYRCVELCPSLAGLLKAFVAERRTGLLFTNRIDSPLSQTNVLRRSLHSILEELKVEKTGFHAMRRFRATWLRKQRAPEDIIKFWLEHAKALCTCLTNTCILKTEKLIGRPELASTSRSVRFLVF